MIAGSFAVQLRLRRIRAQPDFGVWFELLEQRARRKR
jgi:hypothetical protein